MQYGCKQYQEQRHFVMKGIEMKISTRLNLLDMIKSLIRCLATFVFIFLSIACQFSWAEDSELDNRELPAWYQDAKLGIFIHWGLYSVPAFAKGSITFEEAAKTFDFGKWFSNNPYSAWYLNSMKIAGSPTYEYHLKTYGKDFHYENFVSDFNKSIENWDPNSWAVLFKESGAKYVVLTTKHHDGFLLWQSETPNPFKADYQASRNIVAELSNALRNQGLYMGLYYSSGLDWTFKTEPIADIMSFFANVPQQQEYIRYIDNHWRELIRLYKPEILWADIGSPNDFDAESMIRYYYEAVPQGVVNDRHKNKLTAQGIVSAVHYDFLTPEYSIFPDINPKKWESTRGIGLDFSYNKFEDEKDYLSVDKLVDMFVDIVSKNGNLLLGVGPRADGSIPEAQQQRILGLGAWLKVNGEAIYSSRCWDRAEGMTLDDIPVRFTQNNGNLYVILLERPKSLDVTIQKLVIDPESKIVLLGKEGELTWKQQGEDLTVEFPEIYPESEAYVLRINHSLR